MCLFWEVVLFCLLSFVFVFEELWCNRKIASKQESSDKEDGKQRKVDKFVYPLYISFMLNVFVTSLQYCFSCCGTLTRFSQFSQHYMFSYVLCLVTQPCLFEMPWTVARQAPLSLEILQARILEWVAMPSSGGSCQPRD